MSGGHRQDPLPPDTVIQAPSPRSPVRTRQRSVMLWTERGWEGGVLRADCLPGDPCLLENGACPGSDCIGSLITRKKASVHHQLNSAQTAGSKEKKMQWLKLRSWPQRNKVLPQSRKTPFMGKALGPQTAASWVCGSSGDVCDRALAGTKKGHSSPRARRMLGIN